MISCCFFFLFFLGTKTSKADKKASPNDKGRSSSSSSSKGEKRHVSSVRVHPLLSRSSSSSSSISSSTTNTSVSTSSSTNRCISCNSDRCDCFIHFDPHIVQIRSELARVEAELDAQHVIEKVIRQLKNKITSAKLDISADGGEGRDKGGQAWLADRLFSSYWPRGEREDELDELTVALLRRSSNLAYRAERARTELQNGWTLNELALTPLEILQVR